MKIIIAGIIAALLVGASYLTINGDALSERQSSVIDNPAQNAEAETSTENKPETPAPKLHPVEAACVEYEMSGQMTGTSIRCHRKFAYEQYEVQHFTISNADPQTKHTISIGDTFYSIDPAKSTGSKMTNPTYEGFVSAMKRSDPDKIAETLITILNFAPTGAVKNIADIECAVYNSAQMGKVCLTKNGVLLEQVNLGNTLKAVKVSVGDSGDDASYTLYKTVEITSVF